MPVFFSVVVAVENGRLAFIDSEECQLDITTSVFNFTLILLNILSTKSKPCDIAPKSGRPDGR